MVEAVDDRGFKEFVINCLVPFPVMLTQAGLEGYNYNGKCFCPFHVNTETPAAKLYRDGERGDTLFCFSEQKVYHPVDVLKKGLLNKQVSTIFQRLWDRCDDKKREELIELYGKPIDYIPDSWKQNQHLLDKFRAGETTFAQHLSFLVKSLD